MALGGLGCKHQSLTMFILLRRPRRSLSIFSVTTRMSLHDVSPLGVWMRMVRSERGDVAASLAPQTAPISLSSVVVV